MLNWFQETPSKRLAPLPPHTELWLSGDEELGDEWVLMGRGEAPDVSVQQGTHSWLAEVR